MIKKKGYIFFVLMLTLSMLLAACAKVEAPTEVEVPEEVATEAEVPEEVATEVEVPEEVEITEPVTISFWHTMSEPEMEQLDKVVAVFEAENPDIKVETLNVPYDEFRRKLITSMAGGTAPDLIRSDIIWVSEFAHMGALAKLDEVMPDFDTYKEAVFPGPLSTTYFKGHYYGLPLNTNTRILVYNIQMFKDAGIEAPPATMDEFLVACEKIHALGDDKYCFADGGTYAWAVNPWIWSFGGDVTDEEATVASGYLDGKSTKTAYEYIKNLVDMGYIHPGILGGGVDAWGGFGNNEIAMILEGPWFTPFFGGTLGTDYNYAPMPAGVGGSISVVGGEDIVMFQQSQHKEEAAEFIRFMLSEETQITMAEGGLIPVVKSSLDNDYIKNHDYFGYFLEQLLTAKARTPHPNWTKIEDIYNLAGGEFLAGEKSFDEAFGAAAEAIDELLVLPE